MDRRRTSEEKRTNASGADVTYGSVCSGIEAASVAWHPLGWRAAFFSEIDAFPRAVLAERWPDVPLHGDFTTIERGQYADIDVLVGGTPCQSFSVAGLRAGMDDERGNLAIEFLRLAARLGPHWVVWENVPGVLSSNGGRDFGAFLGGLAELGYGWAYRVLDAQYIRVDGYARAVPQRRRRVFVVGHLGDWRRAAAVLFERESLSGHPAPRREAGKGPAAGTVRSTDGGSDVDHRAGHLVAGALCRDSFSGGAGGRPEGAAQNHFLATFPRERERALTASCERLDAETETFVAHSLRADGFDASEDGTGRGTPLVPVRGPADAQPGQRNGTPSTGTADRSGSAPIAFSCKDHGADAGEVAPTLRGMGHVGSHANGGGQVAVAFAHQGGGIQTTLGYDPDSGTAQTLGANQTPAIAIQERAVCENPDTGPQGAGFNDDGSAYTLEARNKVQAVAQHMAVRRLTPREAERLQGFPDGWTHIPVRTYKAKPRGKHIHRYPDLYERNPDGTWTRYAADGPRYKALGNSMPVNVMRWIGMRIQMVEQDLFTAAVA